MVFSSIPAYLDPANWHQQQSINPQTGSNNNPRSHPLFSTAPAPPPSPPQQPHGGGGAGFIRPGSMTERARLANLPIPEAALQCPRCESTNTKFCYFNNYSLSQPRHFCKTCRRYWTRGGALRNVPVGGGCRRNKRSKGSRSSSKSSAATTLDQSTNSANTSTTIASTGEADILGLGPGVPPLRLMAASQNLTHFPDPDSIGLNFGPVSDQIGSGAGDLSFPIGSSLGTTAGSSIFSGLDQWRLTQQAPRFSFLGGLESSMGIFSMDVGAGPARPEGKVIVGSGAPPAPQVDSVKLEESQELNLSRQFLAMNNNPAGNDQQYWNAGGSSAASLWTELSTFSSSATTNTL